MREFVEELSAKAKVAKNPWEYLFDIADMIIELYPKGIPERVFGVMMEIRFIDSDKAHFVFKKPLSPEEIKEQEEENKGLSKEEILIKEDRASRLSPEEVAELDKIYLDIALPHPEAESFRKQLMSNAAPTMTGLAVAYLNARKATTSLLKDFDQYGKRVGELQEKVDSNFLKSELQRRAFVDGIFDSIAAKSGTKFGEAFGFFRAGVEKYRGYYIERLNAIYKDKKDVEKAQAELESAYEIMMDGITTALEVVGVTGDLRGTLHAMGLPNPAEAEKFVEFKRKCIDELEKVAAYSQEQSQNPSLLKQAKQAIRGEKAEDAFLRRTEKMQGILHAMEDLRKATSPRQVQAILKGLDEANEADTKKFSRQLHDALHEGKEGLLDKAQSLCDSFYPQGTASKAGVEVDIELKEEHTQHHYFSKT